MTPFAVGARAAPSTESLLHWRGFILLIYGTGWLARAPVKQFRCAPTG